VVDGEETKDCECARAEVYLGCIDDALWPGVPWRSYVDCAEDWERGWIYDGALRPIVWCVCDNRDDCNVNIGDATSRPLTTPSTNASFTTDDRSPGTQVSSCQNAL